MSPDEAEREALSTSYVKKILGLFDLFNSEIFEVNCFSTFFNKYQCVEMCQSVQNVVNAVVVKKCKYINVYFINR